MRFTFANRVPYQIGEIKDKVKKIARPLQHAGELDDLMDLVGDARYVLLGEASHGTHEYYTWRAKITKRLILEKGFTFIAVEGDWPDCYRVNRYIKHYPDSGNSSHEVLASFNRWPTWMWANWEMVEMMGWLFEHNKKMSLEKRVGFYGLDVYSLQESLEEILKYLYKNDRFAYETARRAAGCFDTMGAEGESYARAAYMLPKTCESEVVKLLKEIRSKIPQYNTDRETVFSTEQNALIAVNAEHYYRAMIKGGKTTWNIRDQHMMDTLNRLMQFHGQDAKAIVWEHNTHIGDARATDMAQEGMINIGQLATQQHMNQGVIKIGFGSYQGTVMAGKEWGAEMEIMTFPPGIPGSWEEILHSTGLAGCLLFMRELEDDKAFLQPIPHRAIGVVYNPDFESFGNYVPSIIPSRYDAFIFLDETIALHALNIEPHGHQIPETFPWGL